MKARPTGNLIATALFVCAALVASACSGAKGTDAHAAVSAASGGSVHAGTATVSFGPGAVSQDADVKVTVGGKTAPPQKYVRRFGQAIKVEIGSAKLQKPATVTFALPPGGMPDQMVPVVVWEDPRGGWRLLPTESSPDGRSVSAQTDHFSSGFLGGIDIGAWAKDAAKSMGNYVTGRSGMDQPHCGDEAALRSAGVTVVSEGGDSVKWCAGHDGSDDVVRISNNRRTYTQVTFPAAWKVADSRFPSISPEAVVRTLGTGMGAAVAPKGTQTRVISGGDTITLTVPPGSSGVVDAEMSFFSWVISALKFAWDISVSATKFVSGVLGAKIDGNFEKIIRLITGGEALNGWDKAIRECRKALTDHLGDPPRTSDMNESMTAVTKFMWNCLPALIQADVLEAGVKMFALGLVLALVGTVVSLVLTAANLLITATREIYDSVASFGGKSNPIYRIAFRRPVPPLTLDMLRNAPVPDTCDHGAGTLVNGTQSGIPEGRGDTSLRDKPAPVFGDVTGDGVPEAIASIACNAGGVAWPDTVIVYGAGPTILATIDLSKYIEDDIGRAWVWSLSYDKGNFGLGWAGTRDGDYACCSSVDATARVKITNGQAVVSGLSRIDELPTLNKVLAAAQSRDRATVEKYSEPAGTESIMAAAINSGKFASAPECHGPTDIFKYPWVGQDTDDARTCRVLMEDGSELDVSMTHPGPTQWRVRYATWSGAGD